MSELPLVSILILNWNGKNIIEPCVGSVFDSDYPKIEVVVVDNISTDSSIDSLSNKFKGDKRLKIYTTDENVATNIAYNIGLKKCEGEFIFILNNDIILDKSCIKNLILKMLSSGVEVSSPKVFTEVGNIDFIGGLMDRCGYAYGRGYQREDLGQFDDQNFFYAGFLMFKKDILVHTGYFDEDICFGWEDLDFSWRIRLAGYNITLVPDAIIYHVGSHTLKRMRSKYFCHFNMRKNRIAGLSINYGLLNLICYMPILFFSYALVFLKELLFDKDMRLSMTSIYAITWNINNFSLLLKKRKFVQSQIRKVPDTSILPYITKESILIVYFLKPEIGRILRKKNLTETT